MARGDSILTPITLEDDDEPQPQTFFPPTVRRRERPRIDHDGIEIQEQQTEWEQAATQRERRRHMLLLALNRASTRASSNRNTGTPTERARERSPSAKATYVIELTDEDEPEVLVPQQPAAAEHVHSALPEAKILPGESGMPSNLDPPESSTQAVFASIGLSLPAIQTATPRPAPRQSSPSASETPVQIPEPVKIAQASPVRTEVVAATHMMPHDDTFSAASVRDSESTLPNLTAPSCMCLVSLPRR
ncbi:hypothetical protein P3342_011370 [Pyrenophora teres f. teres]|nr:hypothetical protein P3342_011370 [Pyrenophora teres f. teres]